MIVSYNIAFSANQLGIKIDKVNSYYHVIDECNGVLCETNDTIGEYIPAYTVEQLLDYIRTKHNIWVEVVQSDTIKVDDENMTTFTPLVHSGNSKKVITLKTCERDNQNDVLNLALSYILDELLVK